MRFDIDIYADNLLLTEEQMEAKKVEQQVIQRCLRLRDIYNYMLRHPLKKEREYIDYIQANYQVDGKPLSKRKAYEDVEILHTVVGNLQQCSKEWHRWRFNNMIMEGYTIALRKEDAAAIAKLAGEYAKYNKLDKDDEHDRHYSELPRIVFTLDVRVMGFQPLDNPYAVMDRVIKQYDGTPFGRIVEDADAVEIANEPEKKNANTDAVPVSQ